VPLTGPAGDDRAIVLAVVERWLARQRRENPVLAAIDRDPDIDRWYVRLRGEERDFVAVWLTVGDYTLRYETYFMPAPEEQAHTLYEFLLRRNHRLYGMRFSIGPEDAIYLSGQLPLGAVDDDELDRLIGSAYAYVERWFRPAMRIGFGARFRG
jgi:Putative bacterial sensory transduction regulator